VDFAKRSDTVSTKIDKRFSYEFTFDYFPIAPEHTDACHAQLAVFVEGSQRCLHDLDAIIFIPFTPFIPERIFSAPSRH